MATTINAANISVGFDASKLKTGTQLTRSEISKLSQSLKASVAPVDELRNRQRILTEAYRAGAITAGQYARTMRDLQGRMRDIAMEAQRAAQATQKQNDIFAGMGGRLAGLASVGAIGSMAKSAVTLAMDLESASIQFEVLTGNSRDAQNLVSSMRDLANTTPLTFSGIATAGQTMLAFGVETQKVIPLLTQLGNVARGDDEKLRLLALAFSQMSSAGRLQGQDLLQMVNAGFNPLLEISQKTGKSMLELRKQMEDGAISVNLVESALASATGEGGRFNGMLDRARETTAGQLAELKADIEVIKTQIGTDLLPVVRDATDALRELFSPMKNENGENSSRNSWLGQRIEDWRGSIAGWKDFIETGISFQSTTGNFDQFLNDIEAQIRNKQKRFEEERAKRKAQTQQPSAEIQAELDAAAKAKKAIEEKEAADKKAKKAIEKTAKDMIDVQKREIEMAQKRFEVEKYGKAIAEEREALRKKVDPAIAKQVGEMVRQTEELDKQQKATEKMRRQMEAAKEKAMELSQTPFEDLVGKITDLRVLLNAGAINQNTFDKAVQKYGAEYQKDTKVDSDGMAKTLKAGTQEAYKAVFGNKNTQEKQLERQLALSRAMLEAQKESNRHLSKLQPLQAYR